MSYIQNQVSSVWSRGKSPVPTKVLVLFYAKHPGAVSEPILNLCGLCPF